MTDWLVAVVNPNCERRATQGLDAAGFEVWWPVRLVQVRVGPKREKRDREFPAFPGYLFVRSARSWHGMLGVDGLKAVLCDPISFAPHRVSDAEIERVRTQLAPLAQSQAVVTMPLGSHVTIQEGPLAGVRGLLTAITRGGAAEVAVDLLGRSTALQIDYSKLEKV